MSWKKLDNHKIPRWVRRRKRRYIKGKTYLYKKINGNCYRKLRNEWDSPILWWQYILIGIIAGVLAQIIIFRFF